MNPTPLHRRDFLKRSAVAAGAAALVQSGMARSVHAAGDELLKIALIGCGGRGTGAAGNCLTAAKILNQPIKLVAVADAFAERTDNTLKLLNKQFAADIDVPE
ncbi:MAG: twin-arginine translocation signal domain-containing protein, partial [Planctomycetes bacterium]|nr:twin-arginine translocation signal domain-containing protein [Planctomycetota bacterium]